MYDFLSPIVAIAKTLRVTGEGPDQVRLEGLGELGAYAVAGVVFAVLALLLYRERRMESVSDFVAIPILKPIFRFCMGFGGASVFAAVAYQNLFGGRLFGAKAAWGMTLLLVIGAFLGWLIAEMLIKRSVRALPLHWKGLCIVWAVCLLTVFVAETDLTGYERRVPDPDQVASVSFSYDSSFSEPENIRALTELQREMVEGKQRYDAADSDYGVWTATDSDYGMWARETEYSERLDRNQIVKLWMPLNYTLKNGSTLQRLYVLPFRSAEVDDAESMVGKALSLLNSKEGIQSRMETDPPMKEENVSYAVINRETADGLENSYRLSPKETVELWNSAMLPDAEAGNLCLYTIADTEENLKTQTSLRIEINLFDQTRSKEPYYWYHSFRVFTFSENCIDWIETHTNLEWETMDRVTSDRLSAYQNK